MTGVCMTGVCKGHARRFSSFCFVPAKVTKFFHKMTVILLPFSSCDDLFSDVQQVPNTVTTTSSPCKHAARRAASCALQQHHVSHAKTITSASRESQAGNATIVMMKSSGIGVSTIEMRWRSVVPNTASSARQKLL